MPSCTNNSTISGIILGSEEAINGKRLAFKQDTSVSWNSGITAGDVIRYDVITKEFSKSVANPYHNGGFDLSLAEVVGIVEKIEQTSGTTYATVVTHGLMNYPSLLEIIAGISSSSGQAGGTDVLFLSPTAPGGITFEVEEGQRYIAKPILQVCPTSDGTYNSIVINYLGYETGENQAASLVTSESNVGELKLIPSDVITPIGWIETSDNQYLPVKDYPSAYQLYGTSYGAKEKLTLNATSSYVSSLLNKQIRPIFDNINPNKGYGSFMKVVEVFPLDNQIIIEHTSGSSLWNNNTKYEISENIGGTNKIYVTTGEVVQFKTPKVETNISVSTEKSIQKYKTIVRVNPDTRVSYLPTSIKFNDIEVSGTLGTENIADVDAKLIDLENRIAALENILGI